MTIRKSQIILTEACLRPWFARHPPVALIPGRSRYPSRSVTIHVRLNHGPVVDVGVLALFWVYMAK